MMQMRWQEELKARMEQQDGSVSAFARRADMSRTQVENYIGDENYNPTLETLRTIAARLGVVVADILPERDRKESPAPALSPQQQAALKLAAVLTEEEFRTVAGVARVLVHQRGTGKAKRKG